MSLRTFARAVLASAASPYPSRSAAPLIQARRQAQATALRDAAEWVKFLGDEPIRPIVIAKMLNARADRTEGGDELDGFHPTGLGGWCVHGVGMLDECDDCCPEEAT